MIPSLIPFAYNDHLFRVVMRGGEPWFVAKDVCDVLGLAKHDTALNRLEDDEKGSHTMGTPGGVQNVSIVSESGFYALAFSSRKQEARDFRKWVTSEVLPTIRKTGAYALQPPAAEEPADAFAETTIAERRLRLDLIREARCTHGPRAARALWDAMGFPTVHNIAPGQNYDPEEEGVMALDRILAAPTADGRTVAERLALALDGDATEREALRFLGLQLREADEGVAFASSTPFMVALFRGRLHPAWALRKLPGARHLEARSFGPTRSRATLVPLAVILPMLELKRD